MLQQTKLTTGQKRMSNLSKRLNIDSSELEARKKIKTTQLYDTRVFDPTKDAFTMTTNMVKLLINLFDCFKDNIVANFVFDEHGINIFALYHSKTVAITTQIGRDLFSDFRCEKEVYTSLSLSLIAKKFQILQKCKIHTLTFSSIEDDIAITGTAENGSPVDIRLKSLTADTEILDLSDFEYPVCIRVKSTDFARIYECMPSVFSITISIGNKSLVFVGDEDLSTTKLYIPLDDSTIDKIKEQSSLINYKCSFLKLNLKPIVSGSKLSEFVIIGLAPESPLFVRYTIDSNINPQNISQVSMYFSPKYEVEDI